MKIIIRYNFLPLLLLGTILGLGPVIYATPLTNESSGANTHNSWYDQLLAGNTASTVAALLTPKDKQDLPALNALRLRLKSADKSALARDFFAALATPEATEAVLLNLSLSYVDLMLGKNLLQQGFLSTRSQSLAEQLIQRDPEHWVAWYIRGINNLYWPDWFQKASYARDYLQQANAIYQRKSSKERELNDMYALGYLCLGDAYALLDQPDEARRTWLQGLDLYPFVAALQSRLALPVVGLHTAIRAIRDANKPIDTDLTFTWNHVTAPFLVNLTGGTLYGPGPLEDQQLKPGSLANLQMGAALSAVIPAFNNGAAEPNLPGEILQGKLIDGRFSDGTEANEHVDVGFVSLMNGKFNLFLAAVQDGPNAGAINFFLDQGWHWIIHDDIGIDPGFPVGVVKFRDFSFSSSPRLVPVSLQTELGAPAGVDRAGSIASGEVVPGALGDADFNGYLDGTFNAIGRFPFDSIILPGAPFAQTRTFTSNIPITPDQATLLTLGNAIGYLQVALQVEPHHSELAATLRQTFISRMATTRRHAEHSTLPARIKTLINAIPTTAGTADICTALAMLNTTAPTYHLRNHNFNAGEITTVCPK